VGHASYICDMTHCIVGLASCICDRTPYIVGHASLIRLDGSMMCPVSFGKSRVEIGIYLKRDTVLRSNTHVLSYLEVLITYRVVKTHRMPYLHRSFSEKEPYNLWLLCG